MECPHFQAGCNFIGNEESMKVHIKECSYGMQEYIKEFLMKKEEELQQQQQNEEPMKLIREALQNNQEQLDSIPNKQEQSDNIVHDSTEYLGPIVNTSKSLFNSVAKGIGYINVNLGISTTLGKTKQVIVESGTWKKSRDMITSTTNSVVKELNDTHFLSTVSDVMEELKQEISVAVTSYHPNSDGVMPEPLPQGWEVRLDPQRRPYFVDHIHKYSTYQDPRLPTVPLTSTITESDTQTNKDSDIQVEQTSENLLPVEKELLIETLEEDLPFTIEPKPQLQAVTETEIPATELTLTEEPSFIIEEELADELVPRQPLNTADNDILELKNYEDIIKRLENAEEDAFIN